jgi:AcrR family transcriptional regulator
MTTQNAPRTARERARAELTREIAEEARRQLAESGANGLSLRAVAKALGMVSSAVYRYYPSRDDLLTALIIDAYDAVGEAAERAIADGMPDETRGRDRWLAACHAIRGWALAHPHEYALIYGSPVPGYRAPEATIGPAARVPLAFAGVLAAATEAGELGDEAGAHAGPDGAADALAPALAEQAAVLSAAIASPVPPEMVVRAVIAWTQLFGMISWELFGQFVGSFEPADAFFAHAADQLATFVGFEHSARAAA